MQSFAPDEKLMELATHIGFLLRQKKIMMATVESCTGGWVAEVLTSIAGSSKWFERGFVTYTNIAKQEMLKVKAETIKYYGAVSKETAMEMALGALAVSHAQFTIAVTGIAGPSGGTSEKPVGTLHFAWGYKKMIWYHSKQLFVGDRHQIRHQAVEFALVQSLSLLHNETQRYF